METQLLTAVILCSKSCSLTDGIQLIYIRPSVIGYFGVELFLTPELPVTLGTKGIVNAVSREDRRDAAL